MPLGVTVVQILQTIILLLIAMIINGLGVYGYKKFKRRRMRAFYLSRIGEK